MMGRKHQQQNSSFIMKTFSIYNPPLYETTISKYIAHLLNQYFNVSPTITIAQRKSQVSSSPPILIGSLDTQNGLSIICCILNNT